MRLGVGLGMVVAIAALALAALHLPARSGASAARRAGACAGDRWFVRTLQDRPKLLPVRASTLVRLRSLRRPSPLPATRHPSERQVVTLVTVAPVNSHPDANGDLRLAMLPRRAGIPVVYATAPAPACNARATSYRRRQMGSARQAIIRAAGAGCLGGRITGVIFFSTRREDNETPNRVQVSPILGFTPCPG
jgi:hypothetical protein